MAPVTFTTRGILPSGLRARIAPERALLPYEAIDNVRVVGPRVTLTFKDRRHHTLSCSDDLAAEELAANLDAVLHPARTRLGRIDTIAMLRQTLDAEFKHTTWIPAGVAELLLLAAARLGVQEILFQRIAGDAARLSVRRESLLHPLMTLPALVAQRLIDHLLSICAPHSFSPSGSRRLEVALPGPGGPRDVVRGEMSMTPGARGANLSIILDDTRWTNLDLTKLGFSDPTTGKLERAARLPRGLVVIAGLAASGRSTTLFALLRRALEQRPRGARGISLDTSHGVEIPNVARHHISPGSPRSLPETFRRVLAEDDADVIAIGELRDPETTQIALEAATTGGRLVLTTLHARTLTEAVRRLQDLDGSDRLDDALAAVIAQRLVRRGCDVCGGRGCTECDDTGFSGLRARGAIVLFSLKESDDPSRSPAPNDATATSASDAHQEAPST